MTEYIYTDKENITKIANAVKTVLGTNEQLSLEEMETSIYSMYADAVIPVEKGGTGYASLVDNVYTTARYRASALYSTETTPTQNGIINWIYE